MSAETINAFLLGTTWAAALCLFTVRLMADRVGRLLRGHRALRPLLMVAAAVLGCGCSHTTIAIPNGAPLMLTEPVVIHRPFVRQRGTWVRSDQDGEAQPGEVVQPLLPPPPAKPAARP